MSGGQAANTKTTSKPARRPGVRRRLLGWGFLIAAALVVVLWVVSVWWEIEGGVGRWGGRVCNGVCELYAMDRRASELFVFAQRAQVPRSWWLSVGTPKLWDQKLDVGIVLVGWYQPPGGNGLTSVQFLLWPIALLTTLGGAGLLVSARRARRRALTHHCPACGYDLIGLLPNAPCPECGPKAQN